MDKKTPFSDYFISSITHLLMISDALLIVWISIKQNSVLKGSVYFLVLSIIACLVRYPFYIAYHLLEVKNEYGFEKKMDKANKWYKIFSYTRLILVVITLIMVIAKV